MLKLSYVLMVRYLMKRGQSSKLKRFKERRKVGVDGERRQP